MPVQMIAFRAAPRRLGEIAQPQHQQRALRNRRPGTLLDMLETRVGFSQALRLPTLWLRRLRLRHELANLDAAQLRDAGLDPELVRRESAKPFWVE